MIKVIQKGLLTTVQDLGRRGWQRYGVPVSGAMDWHAASLANILVGCGTNTPVIEATIIGPTLEITRACRFAMTGAAFAPKLNGKNIDLNRCHEAPAGSRLEMGIATSGARGYVAFSGGIDLPPVMGSVSTNLKAGLGGIDGGRPLQNGDILPLGPQTALRDDLSLRQADPALLPAYSDTPTLRVVLETRPDYFDGWAVTILTGQTYTVSKDSDRMGCRLEGPDIPYAPGFDGNIISDGTTLGSIQVAGGRPILLMADRQTTGGYAKLGGVIMADIPLAAQLRPGNSLRFKAVSLAEAQEAYIAMRTALSDLDRRINVGR
jgi:antagonist of KipI